MAYAPIDLGPAPVDGGPRHLEVMGSVVEVVETDSTIWFLDRSGKRFARVAPTEVASLSPYALDWQACSRIEVDPESGAYRLYLDDSGRRVLRFR